MPASEPFQVQATLTLPPDDGKPPVTLEATLSAAFSKKAEFKLELSGAGTHVVGFGSVGAPGARALWVEFQATASAQQPLQLNFNGGTDDLEISPGGFLLLANPAPVVGITSLSIAHTTAATVRVVVLG